MIKPLLMLTALATATAVAGPFSYTDLSVGYGWGSAELPGDYADFFGIDEDIDLEGVAIAARYEITNNFYAYAGYQNGKIEFDEDVLSGFDIDTWSLGAGLGGYASIADSADVYFQFGYEHTEFEIDDLGDQGMGSLAAQVGIRWAPVEWLEVSPFFALSYGVDGDEIFETGESAGAVGLSVHVTAFQYFQPFASISHKVFSSDDDNDLLGETTLYSAGLRFSF